MEIDLTAIKTVVGIEAKVIVGDGNPLISVTIRYKTKNDMEQAHLIPAPAKVAHEVIGNLYRRGLIDEATYHQKQMEIAALD